MSRILTELHYLPSVAFFSQVIDFEEVEIEIWENYQKGSYRNRCHIVGANGMMRLSVPLEKGKHQQTPFCDVKIAYADAWHVQHWRSISAAYGRSPFWEFYQEDFAKIYAKKHVFLYDINLDFLHLCLKIMKIAPQNIVPTVTFEKNITAADTYDARNTVLPDMTFEHKKYPQVFEDKHGFLPNLSILDLIFCCGNRSKDYLNRLA
jgi:WbqC-like protein family